ncbi:GH32 C-terminal domain-containing protein [Eubacteriales bacterium OttesenSCG-928-A19]|nr:GH32 C-terminal domain-containing protein [Eubacteriales bacterium OttesenSCG-928-A19]
MENKLRLANEFVEQNASTVNPLYRPVFHAVPPIGWINDPNGFGQYKGTYHLFAQFYPYKPIPGPMHWGHWTSADLVDWRWVSAAIAPEDPYDNLGCFSGTSIEDGDRMIIMYTGVHRAEDGHVIQEQCIAESADGVHFTKWAENPVLGAKDLPEGFSDVDFRDPKLMKTADGYRVIIAGRNEQGGCQLLYTSKDLKSWTFAGIFLKDISDMPECPDYFRCDGKDVMITSAMNLPPEGLRFQNGHHDVVYLIGTEQDNQLKNIERMESVDLGPDFYAPESIVTADGRNVMIGWMQMWGEDSPAHYLGHGWTGANTVARELFLREGRLYQRPVRELAGLHGEELTFENVRVDGDTPIPGLSGRCYEMDITLRVDAEKQAEIRVLQTGDECFRIHYDPATQVITTDRTQCGHTMGQEGLLEEKPNGKAKLWGDDPQRLDLKILVDTCSVEVFVNGGAVALTTLAFPRDAAEGISFAGHFTIEKLTRWAIGGGV